MSASVSQLRGWGPAALTEVSENLVCVNTAFDSAMRSVAGSTDDALSQWEGDTAVAAAARALADKLAGSHLVVAVDTYSAVFGDAARELGAARETALSVVDAALSEGFSVLDDGQVIAPTSSTGNLLTDAALQAKFDEQAHVIEEQLRPLLVVAGDVDAGWAARLEDAADAIRTLLGAPAAVEPYSRQVRAVLDGQDHLPSDPTTMARFWGGLTLAEKDGLAAWDPTIGNRDGLPSADKSRYNTQLLGTLADDARVHRDLIESRHQDWLRQENLPTAEGILTDHEDAQLRAYDRWLDERDRAESSLAGYDTVRRELGRAGVDTYLMNIDERGRGAIALGNTDTAVNVATFVPGTSSTLATMGSDMNRVANLLESANTHSVGPNSVVAWLGYEAPPHLIDADSEKFADAGAPRLDRFQEGLRAAHDGPPSNNTVIGHSYGSTVIGHAMRDGASLDADNVVFVGSPGVGVRRADELAFDGVDPAENRAHVFATTAAADPVSWMGESHGLNPAAAYFGATVFDGAPGLSLSPEGTGDYFETWNPSLDTMGAIVAGRAHEAMEGQR